MDREYPGDSLRFMGSFGKLFSYMPRAIFLTIEGTRVRSSWFRGKGTGYVQCCHGGLAPDHDHDIKKLLKSKLSVIKLSREAVKAQVKQNSIATEAIGNSWTPLGFNFQWGDFSGLITRDKSYKSTGRGLVFNFQGIKDYLKQHDIRFVFRGHQDQQYSCKNLIAGIDYPTCLVPHAYDSWKSAQVKAAFRSNPTWLASHASSFDALIGSSIALGDFPQLTVAPVFTFSNASSTRMNYDEGFGVLTVASSWETSTIQYRIDRRDVFALAGTSAGDQFDGIARALSLAGRFEFDSADSSFQDVINRMNFLPRYTKIDIDGTTLQVSVGMLGIDTIRLGVSSAVENKYLTLFDSFVEENKAQDIAGFTNEFYRKFAPDYDRSRSPEFSPYGSSVTALSPAWSPGDDEDGDVKPSQPGDYRGKIKQMDPVPFNMMDADSV